MAERKSAKRKLSSSSIFNPGFYYSDNTFAGGQNIQNCNALSSNRCWNCWDNIERSTSISIPYNRTQEKKFVFHGRFCSLGCAKRYIISKWTHQSLTKMIWLNEAAREVFKIPRPEFVPPSPPMESLKELGGPLTREDFRAKIAQGKCLRSITYPFITFPMKLYEEEKGVEEASKIFAGNDLFALYVEKRAREGNRTEGASTQQPPPPSLPTTSKKSKTKPMQSARPEGHAAAVPKITKTLSKTSKSPKKRPRPLEDLSAPTALPQNANVVGRPSDRKNAGSKLKTSSRKGKRTRDSQQVAAQNNKKQSKGHAKMKRSKKSKLSTTPAVRNTLLNYVLKQ